jgi:hypothetical protein
MLKKIFKLIIIVVITLFFVNILYVDEIKSNPNSNVIINVAVENTNEFIPWNTADDYYNVINDYSWIVGDWEYHFNSDYTEFGDIIDGELKNYDVYAYIGPHDVEFYCSYPNMFYMLGYHDGYSLDEIKKIKDQIKDFIKIHRGGYIGHCSGAGFPLKTYLKKGEQIETYGELFQRRNSFLYEPSNDPIVMLHRGNAGYPIGGLPIIAEHICIKFGIIPFPLFKQSDSGRHSNLAYLWWSSLDPTNDFSAFGGPNIDLNIINPEHPIFNDYMEDSWCVHYSGGYPLYIPPEYHDIEIARFPSYCFDSDESTVVNAWSYPITPRVRTYLLDFLNFGWSNPYDLLSNLTDWEKTSKNIKLGYENLPAAVAFNYPDENGGRVFLTLGHPEMLVWDGGHIQDFPDTEDNSMWKGLYAWYDDEDELMEDSSIQYQANDWFMRRETAWASGEVPENHLPPVYGNSQVVDIVPFVQENSIFDIICCVADLVDYSDYDLDELSLYYQFGTDFTNWRYYDSIYSPPYKFTFDSNEAEGDGAYRFCSLANYSSIPPIYKEPLKEEFPSNPDTWCCVGEDIYAEMTFSETGPYYDTENITFYDASFTRSGTNIINYSWDFGDGNISYGQNITHKYGDNGVYVVWHNVTNNVSDTSSISRNITIRNVPPEADFLPSSVVVKVGEIIYFNESAMDVDGSILECYWDFGDNSTASGFNVNHSYNENGYYAVTLNVTDNDGFTDAKNSSVCTDLIERPDCILVADGFVDGDLQIDDPNNFTWTTIQKGVDNLSSSDILYIKKGFYTEEILINKSLMLVGEDYNTVIINGSLTLIDPHDYEFPNYGDFDWINNVSMNGNELLMHFNNDSEVLENYSVSNQVFDYSGQNNNGTNNGATWTTTTIKGTGAFDFDGIDDSINLSKIPALTGENVTISAWIKWDGGTGIKDIIISQSNSTQGYCLFLNNTDNTPSFRLDDTVVKSSVNLTNGWHHIVGIHNGTSSLLKIFVDGRLLGTVEKADSGIDSNAFIGFDNVSNYFNGKIDEISVWNRTLSDDEISRMYNRNYGIIINSVTIQNSNETGLTICNNSQVHNSNLVNHSLGLYIYNSSNTIILLCNISECDIGIKIIDSKPEMYEKIKFESCYIVNCTDGIIVNYSSYVTISNTFLNCSNINLCLNNCTEKTICTIDSDTGGNVAPDVPNLSGPTQGDINISYKFSSSTNDTNDDFVFLFFCWGDGNYSEWIGQGSQGISNYASHTWSKQGGYFVKVKARDIFNIESNWSEPILFRTENLTPIFNSVSDTPDPIGLGFNVTISTNVTDNTTGNYSGIKSVRVNITYPDSSYVNYSMDYKGNNTYEYIFTDSWDVGQYNYTIWSIDNAYNTASSNGHGFSISVDAAISVCTINNSYTNNCTVNLTDPPSSSYQVGYELLDGGEVLHIWNNLDHYYFDTDSGIQLTNHYNEYWSHNVLMLGYYNNDEWNLIYRTDELSGFNKNIESDNETYVNATLWKNLNYERYDFRLAIRYHLGINDNELTVTPYIKNIDTEDIPYTLGFAWEIKDIQIDMTEENDYIEINGTSYFLNTTGLNETYTNLNIPSFIIKKNITDTKSESLYLRWDESLNYKVQVKSRDGQYNAPVTLGIKIGTLNIGQEKSTELFWYDAIKSTYHFNSYDTMLAWTTTPSNMVDGNTANYASTTIDRDLESCDDNTCAGNDLGTISKVEIRAFGKYSGSGVPSIHDILLKTLGDTHIFSPSTTEAWSSYYDITNNPNAPNTWTWTDIEELIVDVESSIMGTYTVYCSKVEVQVTYNANPVYSNNYPPSGSNGITITPTLNITVNNQDGDTMNLTWLSNSSGSWQIFGTNNSVTNGTYHQTFSNATVNGQWWYWKVNISDGHNYKETDVFSFYTGYQSKIENTGSTNFSGYLLMQIEYYNTTTSTWILEQVVVNETTPRTINIGSTLALDTIFNPNDVSTNSFTNGDGTYQVYAAFCDIYGDVLVCDDESLLEASYQLIISNS